MNGGANVICSYPDSNLKRILVKSLKCWKIYARHKSNRQRVVHKAICSYNLRLKQKALNSLERNCIEAKMAKSSRENLSKEPEVRLKIQKALMLRCRRILTRAYGVWYDYTCYRRKKKALNQKSSYLRNEIFLRKYIDDWKKKTLEKKQNVEIYEKAIDFYRYAVLRKSLKMWQTASKSSLLKKAKQEIAVKHYNKKVLRKICFAWIKYCNIKIEKENRIEEMRKFYANKLVARALRKLSLNVFRASEKKRIFEVATSLCNTNILGRVVRAWIDYHRKNIDYENKVNTLRKKMDISLKRNILKQWGPYVWMKKCSRRKNNMSKSHYNRKIAAKTISSLKNYVIYREGKSKRLDYLKFGITQTSLMMLRIHVDKWRIAVVRVAQDRQKIHRAEDYWRSHQTARYFSIWKEFIRRYRLKNERKNILHEIGKTLLWTKYMNIWIVKYEALATIRDKEMLAVTEYTKKLQSRFFRLWKRYTDDKVARKIDIANAMEFYGKVSLREGLKDTLKICFYKAETRYEEQLKCARENVAEDFDVMRKFFAKWSSIVYAKGNFKDRRRTMEKNQRKIHEYHRGSIPTRLVLPEYMLKNAKLKDFDFCGGNILQDICKNVQFENSIDTNIDGSLPSSKNFKDQFTTLRRGNEKPFETENIISVVE